MSWHHVCAAGMISGLNRRRRVLMTRESVATTARCFLLLTGMLLPGISQVQAEVADLSFYRREPFANGASFGDVGPYEKMVGVVKFAVDPKQPRNKEIVDLDKAPRNAHGKVQFESD